MNSFEREHQHLQSSLAMLSGVEGSALLGHLRECEECAGAFTGVQHALLAALYLPPPRPMDPDRAAEALKHLLARARATPRVTERAARRTPQAVGAWVAAAGLAVLLLTHHAFHRPLGLGLVGAAALGVALFGAALYIVVVRHRCVALRGRLVALEAELARIHTHAFETVPVQEST